MAIPQGRLDLSKLVPLKVAVMQDTSVPGDPWLVIWPEVDEEHTPGSCVLCQGECDGLCEL